MAEESLEDKEPETAEMKKGGKKRKKRRKSEAHHSDIRKLSEPAALVVRALCYTKSMLATFFHSCSRMNQ